jgi:hypothetical protein
MSYPLGPSFLLVLLVLLGRGVQVAWEGIVRCHLLLQGGILARPALCRCCQHRRLDGVLLTHASLELRLLSYRQSQAQLQLVVG